MGDASSPLISPGAFRCIRDLFQRESGIALPAAKQALVASRLRKRLAHHKLDSFDTYCTLLTAPDAHAERRVVIDLLTTNETYFFREPDHFVHLGDTVRPRIASRPLRVWSAASSTGEEAYSLAMTLADRCGTNNWEVLASDLSTRVLEHARRGIYEMNRLQHMPADYLERYCLKGTGEYAGFMRISPQLRDRVLFVEHNLLDAPSALGRFDIIFMRNVLIYFDRDTKQKIVSTAVEALVDDGLFYTGHSESLHGLDLPLRAVSPSIYRRITS